jgi:ABC-type transporter MlaC component
MTKHALINIANVLSERLNTNQPTALSSMTIDVNGKKQLNYEIMFQLLMGEVEKHILENQGHQVVDEFKNSILNKFSSLITQLHPNN